MKLITKLDELKELITIKTNECIEWPYRTTPDGYGVVHYLRIPIGTHRLSYILHNKIDIDEIKGLLVRHKCDNKICINPDHLETGSHQDNTNDRVKRNRSAIGQRHGMAKLSEEDVKAIRSSILPVKEIARLYKVRPWTISQIKRFLRWSHIKE